MRVSLAQLNQTVGDFSGNVERIVAAAQAAEAAGASVLLTPELSLTGYPPEDLLLRRGFYVQCEAALDTLRERTAGIDMHILVGAPMLLGKQHHNVAVLLHRGHVQARYAKHDLPNYDVFDERRYFVPGDEPLVFETGGVRFGVVICEDFWFQHAPAAARDAGAQVLLALNASPYHRDKQHLRIDVAHRNVSSLNMPILTANLVGGQDELVFDGHSFALDARGEVVGQALGYQEDLLHVDMAIHDDVPVFERGRIEPALLGEEQVYRTLVTGVHDYVRKNGFPGVIIGLSGGIDSALTLAIAVDAFGAEAVRAVMMPSRYTADISLTDARAMATRLGVRYDVWPIGDCYDAFERTLADEFAGLAPDATEENIQARIRGTLLMALSNKSGSIVLTTGNKSEMAVGYCTLYGDMAGGFAVIKDVAKTLVYDLARWRNRCGDGEIIPDRIITRAPSAELREDQTDQDSLPPYEVLDGILAMYMEQNAAIGEIVAAGFPEQDVHKVVRLIRINEYKRRQAPVGVRITHRAFGRDWRYPITSRFRD